MSSKLAVVGLGDIRKQDKGITIYLLEKLREIFSETFNISFINGGIDGRDLFTTIENINAEKIIILDTIIEVIDPGQIDYLIIKTKESKKLKELVMVTIGIYSDQWGKKISKVIKEKFYELLDSLSNVIKQFITEL